MVFLAEKIQGSRKLLQLRRRLNGKRFAILWDQFKPSSIFFKKNAQLVRYFVNLLFFIISTTTSNSVIIIFSA